MKAVILTYAPIADSEKNILKTSSLYKLALNQHAEECKPNARIITDYILTKMLKSFPEKIISLREHLRCPSKRVEYFNSEFKGSTIIAAIEYLIFNKYDEILIIGDNKVNTIEFSNKVNDEIYKLKDKAKLYQYTNGYFKLPVKSITEFCQNT